MTIYINLYIYITIYNYLYTIYVHHQRLSKRFMIVYPLYSYCIVFIKWINYNWMAPPGYKRFINHEITPMNTIVISTILHRFQALFSGN